MSLEQSLFTEPLSHAPAFIWGMAGGMVQEVLRWRGLERRGRLPRYLTQWTYWVLTIVFAGFGGFMAMVVREHTMWGAVALGASWPALLSRGGVAAARKPKAALGTVDGFVDWLRG